jgi:hypothetical protein
MAGVGEKRNFTELKHYAKGALLQDQHCHTDVAPVGSDSVLQTEWIRSGMRAGTRAIEAAGDASQTAVV